MSATEISSNSIKATRAVFKYAVHPGITNGETRSRLAKPATFNTTKIGVLKVAGFVPGLKGTPHSHQSQQYPINWYRFLAYRSYPGTGIKDGKRYWLHIEDQDTLSCLCALYRPHSKVCI